MRHPVSFPLVAALFLATTLPAAGQEAGGDLIAELARDLEQVEQRMLSLARAIPDSTYDWMPSAGTRPVREVLLHVASANYFFPALMGTPPPAGVGIVADDYATVEARERRRASRDEVIADLEASFAHLIRALRATSPDQLGGGASLLGRPMTRQRMWIRVATHLHEHLGQMIAYARSRGVVPPWSR